MSLNDFKIGRLLGKGAFGIVLLVKRILDGQTYAMKQVRISQLTDKERENALNEIRILASLSHKNIIGYKDAFFDEKSKTLNIVMEFADGGDMSKKIKYNLKHGLLFRENIIWNYLIQTLEGLNYLHEKNIIHRDLKSANIFITRNGTIKIGDLNVSKIAKVGMAYTQTGTPYYASPEIWLDKPYDFKSDIWSLGCILYELCQLKPPFRGTSLKNLCNNIQRGIYEPIMSFYSDDLRTIIAMMLKTNPNMRPTTSQILSSSIIINKKKELKIGLSPQDLLNQYNEEQKGLIATIKMPRNLREINGNLPMNKYNKYDNIQRREEMLREDEYETNKRNKGFLSEEDQKEMQRLYGNDYMKNRNNNINNNMKNNMYNHNNINNIYDNMNSDIYKNINNHMNYNMNYNINKYMNKNINNNIDNNMNNNMNNHMNNNMNKYMNNMLNNNMNNLNKIKNKNNNNIEYNIININKRSNNNNSNNPRLINKIINNNNNSNSNRNYYNNDLNSLNFKINGINNNDDMISLNNNLIQNRKKLDDYNFNIKKINNNNYNNNNNINGKNKRKENEIMRNNSNNYDLIVNSNKNIDKEISSIDDYISQNIKIYNNINKYYYPNYLNLLSYDKDNKKQKGQIINNMNINMNYNNININNNKNPNNNNDFSNIYNKQKMLNDNSIDRIIYKNSNNNKSPSKNNYFNNSNSNDNDNFAYNNNLNNINDKNSKINSISNSNSNSKNNEANSNKIK